MFVGAGGRVPRRVPWEKKKISVFGLEFAIIYSLG
jgi:hypothetical protein